LAVAAVNGMNLALALAVVLNRLLTSVEVDNRSNRV
jgi:hypothetical protein